MKAIKYALLLFAFFSLDAWGQDINRFLSGSWYNPAQDGHGFSVPDSLCRARSALNTAWSEITR